METEQGKLDQLQHDLKLALEVWHDGENTPQNLLEYLHLVQAERRKLSAEKTFPLERLATNQVLLAALGELAKQDETAAQILRWRYLDNLTQEAIGNKLNANRFAASRQLKAAYNQLVQILLQRETAARVMAANEIESGLPPSSYSKLFGVNGPQKALVEQLLRREGPPLVAISGLGGIGKTALADKATRQVIRHFVYDRVFWLRLDPQTMTGRSHEPEQTFQNLLQELAQRIWPDAKEPLPAQQRLTQVRHELKSRPHLIIIDNLESESDTAYLLDRLNDLARPGKFLVTSRSQMVTTAAVYDISLSELPLADATELVRHQALDCGYDEVAAAGGDDIGAIYQVVGGNPHFLKLVVGLLHQMPLPDVLEQLRIGREESIEKLYRHIYWQTWQLLSPNAKKLLQNMPLVAESGGMPPFLMTISSLPAVQFWPALQELQRRSLVEVRGTLHEKLYGIHQLTRTFIQTDIIGLSGSEVI